MKSPLAVLILFLCLAFTQGQGAVKVVTVGVRTPAECPALTPLVTDLKAVPFPVGWTIYVVCTLGAWDDAGRQLDTRGRTNAAITSQAKHFTVINGAVYSSFFDWTGTRQRNGQEVLRHERGHILCRCNDEDKADKAAPL